MLPDLSAEVAARADGERAGAPKAAQKPISQSDDVEVFNCLLVVKIMPSTEVVYWAQDAYKRTGTTSSRCTRADILSLSQRLPRSDPSAQRCKASIARAKQQSPWLTEAFRVLAQCPYYHNQMAYALPSSSTVSRYLSEDQLKVLYRDLNIAGTILNGYCYIKNGHYHFMWITTMPLVHCLKLNMVLV
jgi:hypothetical protein